MPRLQSKAAEELFAWLAKRDTQVVNSRDIPYYEFGISSPKMLKHIAEELRDYGRDRYGYLFDIEEDAEHFNIALVSNISNLYGEYRARCLQHQG